MFFPDSQHIFRYRNWHGNRVNSRYVLQILSHCHTPWPFGCGMMPSIRSFGAFLTSACTSTFVGFQNRFSHDYVRLYSTARGESLILAFNKTTCIQKNNKRKEKLVNCYHQHSGPPFTTQQNEIWNYNKHGMNHRWQNFKLKAVLRMMQRPPWGHETTAEELQTNLCPMIQFLIFSLPTRQTQKWTLNGWTPYKKDQITVKNT